MLACCDRSNVRYFSRASIDFIARLSSSVSLFLRLSFLLSDSYSGNAAAAQQLSSSALRLAFFYVTFPLHHQSSCCMCCTFAVFLPVFSAIETLILMPEKLMVQLCPFSCFLATFFLNVTRHHSVSLVSFFVSWRRAAQQCCAVLTQLSLFIALLSQDNQVCVF